MDALLTYDYGKEKIKKMVELGYNIILKEEKNLLYSDEFENVEVLICYNPFKTLDISKFQNLKWIQLSSIGIDQLPIEKLINQNIVVSNNQGGYSKPMGEWVVLSILEILKNKKGIFVNQQKKQWKMDTSVLELVNKKILFLGTGTIAKESAKRLKGFECLIDGINTSGREQEYFNNVYKSTNINKIINEYDIVISTLPKIESTFHYINKEFMDLMKKDSILINVSRGEIIDENELIYQLKSGKFLGVSLDVFENEPLGEASELWGFDRVYISSHNSWISEMKNERRFDMIYENLKRYKKNNKLINEVNYLRGY
ncbi:phosphoglycerate dehydrogenase [Clostridiaceae bacterium HSG29]|nr:phosphoglycerate dehydrogenase [Clostridiaceae bacterium HSG29]